MAVDLGAGYRRGGASPPRRARLSRRERVGTKRDTRDGKYRLMEVDARRWMWHSLGTACGVNLSLAAYYRDAIGEP